MENEKRQLKKTQGKKVFFAEDLFKDLNEKEENDFPFVFKSPVSRPKRDLIRDLSKQSVYDINVNPKDCLHLVVNLFVSHHEEVKQFKGKTVIISQCLNCDKITEITIRDN